MISFSRYVHCSEASIRRPTRGNLLTHPHNYVSFELSLANSKFMSVHTGRRAGLFTAAPLCHVAILGMREYWASTMTKSKCR